jgi:erythromycin esterase
MKRMAILGLLCIGAACESGPAEPPVPATPAEYLQRHAIAMRSLDPGDEDFSDLEPLRRMIGDARIVGLGEATHGDGATLLAKTRLVKFLHREMGFDVLAWESGFYDVQKSWSWVKAGEPVVPSFQRGIFSAWTLSAQAAPLLEYAAREAHTARPLEVVGFDMQFSAAADVDRAANHLAGDLRALFERRGSSAADDARFAHFAASIPNMYGEGWLYVKPTEAEREEFLASVAFLRDELVRLGAAVGPGELGYWLQVMESVEQNARGRWLWSSEPGEPILRYTNHRDRQMALNLIWHADHGMRGRKIIVYGATSHTMRHRAGPQNIPRDRWMSLGDHLHDAYGDAMYTIGFTSHEGTWGYPIAGQPIHTLAPMAATSLEGRFVEAGFELGIVDLRSPAAGGEWLHLDFTSRPLGHVPQHYRWSRSLDAMVFIRTMTPSTPWTPGG